MYRHIQKLLSELTCTAPFRRNTFVEPSVIIKDKIQVPLKTTFFFLQPYVISNRTEVHCNSIKNTGEETSISLY